MDITNFRVVDTDNFGGDYPDEEWASPVLPREETAKKIADLLNEELGGPRANRYYKVVKLPYKLQPGFEP